jgi:NAD-dependent DNA ligase
MNKNLISQYHEAKAAYYEASPIMSDEAFDALERLLVNEHPELLRLIGSPVRTGKQPLPQLMGSLNQIRTPEEFDRWKKTTKVNNYIASEKLDGNSCMLVYKKGFLVKSFSRGNGIQGADNTRHTSRMNSIPRGLLSGYTGTVRGEVIVSKSKWPQLQALAASKGDVYANARNFVAGFLNATTSDPDFYDFIDFVAFEMTVPGSKEDMLSTMKENGFITPLSILVKDPEFEQMLELVTDLVKKSAYELDGVVLDVDGGPLRDVAVTEDDLNPVYAVKIKVSSGSAVTTVLDIEWQISKNGLLKPVVVFEPVSLSGVTIRKASGYNARFIYDNKIQPGSVVVIRRAGEVIPQIAEVIYAGPLC